MKTAAVFQRSISRAWKLSQHRFKQTISIDDEFLRHPSQRHFEYDIEKECVFWAKEAKKLTWFKKWNKLLDHSMPPFTKWFVGGMMNTCYNAIDRHIRDGFGNNVALYWDSPVTEQKQSFTYNDILKEVTSLALALQRQGVQKGDVVLIYMPMIPQAMFAMLASARIGAIHSLVFGGFAAKQLASRIAHSQPKVVVTSTFGKEGMNKEIAYLPIMTEALRQADFMPRRVIVYNRPETQRDYSKDMEALERSGQVVLNYQEITEELAGKTCDCIPLNSADPIYILYTSGTTGDPKGVVVPSASYTVAMNWSISGIYGMAPGEPWAALSDLGWVVGHSYSCYAPMIHRNPTVLYEGKPVGTPDAGAMFRLVQEYKLAGLFTSPTALRAVKKEDPDGNFAKKFNMKDTLRCVYVGGEHFDSATLAWAKKRFRGIPVLNHWWQTESGWPIAATCMKKTLKLPPSPSVGNPCPGWHVEVLNPYSKRAEPNELGTIAVKMPLPPGSLSSLFKSDQRFIDAYFKRFPGYYNTSDAGFMDRNGNLFVMGRVDDVINVAGHRLSAGSIEEAIQLVDEVAEAAVVGKDDNLKGQVPFAFCVLKSVNHPRLKSPGSSFQQEAIKTIAESVRKNVGAIASLSGGILLVDHLPKTRSGKISRNTLAAMINKKVFDIPSTIEDAEVYWEISKALKDSFKIDCILPDRTA